MTTSCDVVAQRQADPNLPVVGTDLPELEAVDAILLDWLRANGFEAATIAIMKDRRLVYEKGYGWQDEDRTRPILPDAIMRLASNTKPVTARAIQQLIEDGMLDPEEPVYEYLGISPTDTLNDRRILEITVQHLLDHESGLIAGAPGTGELGRMLGLNRSATMAETIAYAWTQDLLFDPGTRSEYSNLGYQILGHIIEKASGQTYEQFIRDHIARPLGIRSFQVGRNRLEEAFAREIWYAGQWYSPQDIDLDYSLEFVPQPYAMDMEARPGAGSLVSSAADYCRFLKAYFHTGGAKPDDLRGWTWRYTFFGGLPGTLTATRDIVTPDGASLTYVVLVNERVDGKDDLLGQLVSQLDAFLMEVTLWPDIDLFQREETPLVAHWPFDETAGTWAADLAGANDAQVHGADWTDGILGGALDFDGGDDSVNCGSDPTLAPERCTLSFWVQPEPKFTKRALLRKSGPGFNDKEHDLTLSSDGQLTYVFGDGSKRVTVSTSSSIRSNDWTHVAVTRDGAEACIFLDGVTAARASYTLTPLDNNHDLIIGRDGSRAFFGKIDDVRIYAESLAEEDLLSLIEGAN